MASASNRSVESFGARLRAPGYLILIITAAVPLFDFGSALWPLHFADPTWRFGVLGLSSNYGIALVGELFLIFALALFLNDRKVLLTLGILTAIGVVLTLGCLGAFALDALQTKARVTPQTVKRFEWAAAEATVKLLLVLFASFVLSRSAFRAARREAGAEARTHRTVPATPLIARPSQPSVMGAPDGATDA